MTKRKRTILIIAAAAVVVVGFTLPKFISSRGPAAGGAGEGARDQRMKVRMEIAKPESVGDRVTMVGTLLANEEVEIRSEVPGKVTAILFREGARVKRGAPLLKTNDADLQAQLLRAESRLAIARQTAERQRQLFEKSLVSEEANTTASNELNVARAELQIIQAQLEKATLRAPFDGVIGLRNVSEGSYISPTTLITTLQDNNPVKVDFRVPEKYMGLIKTGDKISFRVQGNSRPFEASIYSMDSRVDAVTRTLRMRAVGPNPGGVLMPGALASVDIELQKREALTIPAYALIPELKGHKVFVAEGGAAVSRPVEIGMRTDTRVEITRGLQKGDTLITSGILQLRAGMPVMRAAEANNGNMGERTKE